jgi:hypothetical protein
MTQAKQGKLKCDKKVGTIFNAFAVLLVYILLRLYGGLGPQPAKKMDRAARA